MVQNEKFNNNIIDSLEYARKTFSIPIIVHSNNYFNSYNEGFALDYRIRHILPFKFFKESIEANLKDCTYVFDTRDLIELPNDIKIGKCILNVSVKEINNLYHNVIKLFKITNYINLNVTELDKSFNPSLYEEQLNLLKDYLVINQDKSIDILSDLINMKFHKGCKAGERSFTISPDGDIYICPAFYDLSINNKIGNIQDLKLNFEDSHLFKLEYKPLCQTCDIHTCNKCSYLNKLSTGEVNVPPSFQCIKSHIEKRVTLKLYKALNIHHSIEPSIYDDPIKKWLKDYQKTSLGFYRI